uniref:Reverse transcriptase n=1 Tax=Haemonchus contortus TaxID=6289 RepID=A0A7I4Y0H8_HAECO
ILKCSQSNCFSLKHEDKGIGDHPTVIRWLVSCDFSSAPDVDDLPSGIAGKTSSDCVVFDSVLVADHIEGDCDGYITALENLDSEKGDGSGDTVEELAQSSCDDNPQQNLYVQLDDESVYETSDKQGLYEIEKAVELWKLVCHSSRRCGRGRRG